MIEEALGLNIYHWKLAESERKLAKTEENIREVESLRREIAPHLKFLKKQVEKIEQADALRRELKQLYLDYFKIEADYLAQTKQELAEAKAGPAAELKEIEAKLASALKRVEGNNEESLVRDKLRQLEGDLEQKRREHEESSRALGRLEGRLEAARESASNAANRDDAPVSAKLVQGKLDAVLAELTTAESANDLIFIKNVLSRLRGLVSGFIHELGISGSRVEGKKELITKLESEQSELAAKIKTTNEQITKLTNELSSVRKNLESLREATQGAERQSFELKTKKAELTAILNTLAAQAEKLAIEEADFKRELETAAALTDQEVRDYTKQQMFGVGNDRGAQEDRRRQIERKKIKLEDMGFEGSDVLTEYKETTKRDEFLAAELADLESSRQSLESVMGELKDKLQTEFNQGMAKINEQFSQFFKQMFGGGEGKLQVVKEVKKRRSLASFETDFTPDFAEASSGEEEGEMREGIEINVSLPRKKVKGLEMLSGGERALTSIALLFAMSQVNPPPFLILDETDAALDEANSRKYGDMIEMLAKYSQLILITHNRETMSRAGVLYGVTMGADGVSKLLSIRFDQAESYAK